MMFRESRGAVRRVLLQLGPGDELVASVREVAERHAVEMAWVRGVGTVSRASLVGGKAPAKDGPWQLLNLGGSVRSEGGVVALSLHATLVAGDGRVQGGALRKAEVEVAELVLECFETASASESAAASSQRTQRPRRAPNKARPAPQPDPTRDRWTSPDPEPVSVREDSPRDGEPSEGDSSAPTSGGAVTWADVAAFSAAPDDAPEPLPKPTPAVSRRPSRPNHKPPPPPSRQSAVVDELLPRKGDFVAHRQFGTCKVEREDGNGGIVLKLQSGVRKTIKLAYMEVGAPRDERGRRVFPIRPRKR